METFSPTDATVALELNDSLIDIPGYEVTKTLGRGGMGMVYLARQKGMLEREVAIKTILPKHVDEAFRRSFLEEGQRQAELHHPNILPIFAAGEAGDVLYLAMHYARDGSLRDRMDDGVLSPAKTVKYICDTLAALDHAHNDLAASMAHLDVKPENILFDADNIYLADFGIAQQFEEDGTVTHQIAGDPRYWAPEQQDGEATVKSDLYALGVMFFEMLTGDRPPRGLKTIASINEKRELTRLLPKGTRKFGATIARCLNPDPHGRPDPGEMKAELEAIQLPRGPSAGVIAIGSMILIAAVALSQPTVRDAIGSQWLELFPPDAYAMKFEIAPASAKLWLDGQEEPLRQVALAEGAHRVVAVAPGYIGETSMIEVAAGLPPVSFDLSPIPELSDEEYLRFVQAFDGTNRSYAMEWQNPTLRRVVQLDEWESTDPQGFERSTGELSALAEAGDAVAATSLFFAAFEGLDVPGGVRPLIPGLIRASDEGYGIASLLRALYVMNSLFEAEQTFNNNPSAFEEVESLLKRAADQGLPRSAALVANVAGISSIPQAPE